MLKELLDEVRAAREAETADKARRDRIKKLLVDVRLQRKDLTVVDIEAQIERYYDRATISRITAPAVRAAKAAPTPS